MRTGNIFLGLLAVSSLLLSCGEKKPAAAEVKGPYCLSDTMKGMITIDSVSICRIDDEIQLSGEVGFDENKIIKIFPRSSGQVIESNVSFGDKVQAGQVLAVIKSADVAGNYADLAGADADIAIAKRQMDNAESLYKSGISSEKDFTEAQQNYQKALAAKSKIESLISINGGTQSKPGGNYVITSPITGYIVEKKVNAGNFIRSDASDNIFTISDLKDVWILANVFETDIPRVKEGLHVKVTTLAYPDKYYDGIIEKSSDVLDPVSKALKVRIRLSNPDMLLKPEMFARVIVTNELEGSAVCLSSKAVIEEGGRTFVIIYNNDCDLKKQEVFISKTAGDKIYVSGGVKPGDKVIIKNALLLYNQFSE